MAKHLLPLLLICVITGCNARIPTPVGYEFNEQQKMQAAHHWNVLADDVADRINRELILNDLLDSAVFIKQTCGDEDVPCVPNETSPFNEAFRDLLITDLVNTGVPVQQKPDPDAITVHYKVQLVYHDANRMRTIRPGMITALATGVMVLRNAPSEVITIATAGLIDLANQNFVLTGHYEVIITTSMVKQDQYLFRTSDIYYINDRDSFHYQVTRPQTADIPLQGPPMVE